MERQRFEFLVAKAISELPPEIASRLENVDIAVLDWPTTQQLAATRVHRDLGLLGLYEGVPQTKRDRGYSLVLPDRITIFKKPIEAICRSESEIEREIRRVVQHEIAHHFGIGEARLGEIERRRRRRR
jgi:predicted Zn-dependent protease with MMP-like domain